MPPDHTVTIRVGDAAVIKRVLRFATDISALASARPDDTELNALVDDLVADNEALQGEHECESDS